MGNEVLTARRGKKGLSVSILGSSRRVLQYRISIFLLHWYPQLRALYFPTVLNSYKTTGKRMRNLYTSKKVELNRTTWKCSLWVGQLWTQHFCYTMKELEQKESSQAGFYKDHSDCSWWRKAVHWLDVWLQTGGKQMDSRDLQKIKSVQFSDSQCLSI